MTFELQGLHHVEVGSDGLIGGHLRDWQDYLPIAGGLQSLLIQIEIYHTKF